MSILVYDIGTSAGKGVLYDDEGKILGHYKVNYHVVTDENGNISQDPLNWRDAIYKIGQNLHRIAEDKQDTIEAIVLTSQRSSVIPVDQSGIPLHDAIMWQDSRNADIISRMAPYEMVVRKKTGVRLNTVFSGGKMAWISQVEPEIYRKAYKLCCPCDFIAHIITGEFFVDETYGSRSLLMDGASRKWDPELLLIFGIDETKLSTIMPVGCVGGESSRDFAEHTGIQKGTPFISAGGDQQCGALGNGVLRSGDFEINTGTGAYIFAGTQAFVDPSEDGIFCQSHAVPGKYALEGSVLSCASAFNWLLSDVYHCNDFKVINDEIQNTPVESNDVLFLPYLQGTGTPSWNANASGVFYGLRLGTTRGQMTRALLESIAIQISDCMQLIERHQKIVNVGKLSGGLTNSLSFRQIMADVLGMPMAVTTNCPDITAFGAWISAVVALKKYPDYIKAYEYASQYLTSSIIEPNEKLKDYYRHKTDLTHRIYDSLFGG